MIQESYIRQWKLTVGNETRDILLSPSSFDTVKRFSERIEETVALSGNPTMISPAVFDFVHSRPYHYMVDAKLCRPSYKAGYLLHRMESQRTKFVGTDSAYMMMLLKSVDCMYRPGVDYLRYFSSESGKSNKSPLTEGIPMCLMQACLASALVLL